MNARVMNIRSEYREACVPRFGGNGDSDRSFWKRAHAKAIRRIDAVGEDFAANDAYVPSTNEYEGCGVCPWDGPCPHCDLPPVIESEPGARPTLRAPLAEIARAA